MSRLSVEGKARPGGWTYTVRVADAGGATEHAVDVSEAYARKLGGGSPPDDLVRRSFEFLLARESKESILRRFELPAIGRYFPDYEAAMKRHAA